MTTATDPRAGFDDLGEGVARTEYDPVAPTDNRAFRFDIQGLRAIAVLAVVLYHSHTPLVTGGYVGVDVFFVISGVLVTSHLLSEVDRTARVSLPGFYARRIRRLLPAALIVVMATIGVSALWGPVLEVKDTARDGLYAAFYAMNYHLAADGLDYQPTDAAASPFLHFWALAVVAQFYLVWPLVVLVVAGLTRRAPRAVRTATLAVVVLVAILVSLRWSIETTDTNAPLAYFSIHTRAWEIGIGALVAVALPLLQRLPALLVAPLSWTGLGLVMVPMFVFDDHTSFPGWLAAVPVVGAALVMVAGVRAVPDRGAERLLRCRPLQFLGAASYGWYLWHWPVLVLGPSVFGHDVGWGEELMLVVLALWFAVLTLLLVERPSVRLRVGFGTWVAAAAAMSAAVVGMSVAATALAPGVEGRASAETLDLHDRSARTLARALDEGGVLDVVPANLEPALASASDDVPRTTADGCHLSVTVVAQPDCVYGSSEGARTMLLLGDSHAEQWFGALDEYASTHDFRLVSWTKAACSVADTALWNEQLNRDYSECGEWRAARFAAVAQLRPDVIVMSQSDTVPGPGYDDGDWAAATGASIERLAATSSKLVFLADTPRPDVDVPQCLTDHLDSPVECSFAAPAAVPASDPLAYLDPRARAVRRAAGDEVSYVKTGRWLCRGGTCPAIIGNVLAYRDRSHITQAMSRALAPIVAIHLDRAVGDRP